MSSRRATRRPTSSPARPSAGNPPSPACSTVWTTATTSPPAEDRNPMTTVGLIGSGNLGITLAQLAIEAGHQVVLSNSRGSETLTGTVAQLGPRAAAATIIDTCNYG